MRTKSQSEFWNRTALERDRAFAELRRSRPVSFQRPPEGRLFPSDTPYWAVVRHSDVVFVSRHPELFCSGQGVTLDAFPLEFMEPIASFLIMDAPRHNLLRRLVTGAFAPRRVAAIEDHIRQRSRQIVRAAVGTGSCEIVEHVATPLSLATISSMIGVPAERRDRIYAAFNMIADSAALQTGGSDGVAALIDATLELISIAVELATERRTDPRDDLMTALVQAEVDVEHLTNEDIAAFFVLVTFAGNDTTRNSIAHGVQALAMNPEQWDLLRCDLRRHLDGAVDEIIRWATPVMSFRRTATQDTVLSEQRIAAGDHVVFFYTSANRDEAAFEDPWRFDIERSPNEHLEFGGGRPHYCVGAQLARTQLKAIFSDLASTVERLETGPPEYLLGNFAHGVKRHPCRFVTPPPDLLRSSARKSRVESS